MTSPEQAAARYAVVTAVDQQVSEQAKAAWYAMNLRDLQGSFAGRFVPEVVPALTGAQTVAASFGAQSIAQATGQPVSIIPGAFAGYASDGRGLPGLLAQPLIDTYVNLAGGMDSGKAMDSGWDSIDRMLATQIHDSARQAESVQMVEHRVTYYIRQVEPGACGRCVILAGAHYKVNTGFLRHDHCRCFHVAAVSTYLDPVDGSPGAMVGAEAQSPYRPADLRDDRDIFNSLSRDEQDRTFTAAGAEAIRLGANIPQIVNSRRSGMSTVTDRYGQKFETTTVGAKRGQTRLLPESILRVADGDMDVARRLLVKHGYVRG
jgi:hypothetical protein